MRARGRNIPHRRVQRDESSEKGRVTRVSMDDNFAGEDDEDAGKLLTMVDSTAGSVRSEAVESKGASAEAEWVIKEMSDELDS